MEVSYIRIKPSRFVKDYTVRDVSIVSALVYMPKANPVNMSNLEKLAIYLEQYILADYLYYASHNKDILKYRDKVKKSFIIKKNEILNTPSNITKFIEENYITKANLDTLTKFFDDPDSVSVVSMLNLTEALDKCKFDRCSFLKNFYTPYLSQKLTNQSFNNPVILTPMYSRKVNKDTNNRTPIILLPTSYTKNTYRKVNVNKEINNNKFYTYFANMDFNNQSWQSIVDVLQKFNLSSTVESLSNVSGLLNHYMLGHYIPGMVDKSDAKEIFLSLFNYIDKHNTLSTNDAHPEELARLMSSVFADDRCYYLLDENPEIKAVERWNTYRDLACFTKFGLEAKEDGADDSESGDTDSDESGASGDDDSTTDTDTTDSDDSEGDNLEDDGGGDDSGDADDFGDFGSDEDSGSSESNDSGDESEEADPEDVNPLIQIIENESFDEYLERGAIEKKLLTIFNNPPSELSVDQLNTMKFWYTQWFPLVSVETTKRILGDLLNIDVNTDDN